MAARWGGEGGAPASASEALMDRLKPLDAGMTMRKRHGGEDEETALVAVAVEGGRRWQRAAAAPETAVSAVGTRQGAGTDQRRQKCTAAARARCCHCCC
jgi:hypothetical protein